MTAWITFKAAIADVTRRPYPVLWLWIGNLLIALAVTAPFYALADAGLSHSLVGRRLLGSFDVTWLMDGAATSMNTIPMATPLAAAAALGYLLLSTFLTGGSLAHLADRDRHRTTAAVFFSDSGRLFPPLSRLLVLALVGYGLALGALALLLDAALSPWTGDPLTEWAGLIAGGVKALVLLLAFSILSMVFDYARVTMVLDDDARAVRSLGRGLAFVRRNFGAAWLLYLLCAAVFGAAALLYLEVYRVLPDDAVALIAVAFIFHQLFVAARCGIRLVFFASEIGLVQARR